MILHEIKGLQQVIFDCTNAKISKSYSSKPIQYKKCHFKVVSLVIMKQISSSENFTFLGTICGWKCHNSVQNENLLSCDKVIIWDNFLVWSNIFAYFNFYFTHLVVKHPVRRTLYYVTSSLIFLQKNSSFRENFLGFRPLN